MKSEVLSSNPAAEKESLENPLEKIDESVQNEKN